MFANAEVVMDRVSEIYEASETVEEMEQHLAEIKAMPNVEDAYRDDIAICVKIKDGGIIMWCFYPDSEEEEEKKGVDVDELFKNISKSMSSGKGGSLCEEKSVCLLDAMNDRPKEEEYYRLIGKFKDELNWDTCIRRHEKVNLTFIEYSMPNYGVIIYNAHGVYSNGLHWWQTGLSFSEEEDNLLDKYNKWNDDLIRIFGHSKGFDDLMVSEVYFKKCISKRFPQNSIFFSTSCNTYKENNSMWITLKDKGLGCLLGFDNTVFQSSAINCCVRFFNEMLGGATASDACATVRRNVSISGPDGPVDLLCYPENSDIILVEKEPVGDDWVDLGLPSGLLWATRNVGATSPEDYGDYFAWGETTPKSVYSGITYIYSRDYDQLTKYCNNSDYGYNGFTDNLTILQPGDDAATANYGGRTPTKEEWEELINNTTVTWTTQNGVNGRLFTGTNGNSLFLPAAGFREYFSLDDAGSYGYYWSSSLHTDDPDGAWDFGFDSGYQGMNGSLRYCGLSVRAVRSAR